MIDEESRLISHCISETFDIRNIPDTRQHASSLFLQKYKIARYPILKHLILILPIDHSQTKSYSHDVHNDLVVPQAECTTTSSKAIATPGSTSTSNRSYQVHIQ